MGQTAERYTLANRIAGALDMTRFSPCSAKLYKKDWFWGCDGQTISMCQMLYEGGERTKRERERERERERQRKQRKRAPRRTRAKEEDARRIEIIPIIGRLSGCHRRATANYIGKRQ